VAPPAGLPRRRHVTSPLRDRHDPGARLAGTVLQAPARKSGSDPPASSTTTRSRGRDRLTARAWIIATGSSPSLPPSRDHRRAVLDERDGLLADGACRDTLLILRRRADRCRDGQASGSSGPTSPSSNTGSRFSVPRTRHRLDLRGSLEARCEGPHRHEGTQSRKGGFLHPAAVGPSRRRGTWTPEGTSSSWRRAKRHGRAGASRGGRSRSLPRGIPADPSDADETFPHIYSCAPLNGVFPFNPRGRVRAGVAPFQRGSPAAPESGLCKGSRGARTPIPRLRASG